MLDRGSLCKSYFCKKLYKQGPTFNYIYLQLLIALQKLQRQSETDMAEPTKIKSICFEKMYGVLRPLKL